MEQPGQGFNPERFVTNERIDILEEHAELLRDVSTLITELPTLHSPDSMSHCFTIMNLDSENLALPVALADETIDDITIELGDAVVSTDGASIQPAYLSISFESKDASYFLSSSGVSNAKKFRLYKLDAASQTDRAEGVPSFENRLSRPAKVPLHEINALLLSIALPNEKNDYSAFRATNLQQGAAYESLVDLLAPKATEELSNYHFSLTNGMEVHYIKENDQLISVTIRLNDETRHQQLAIEFEVQKDFTLKFFTISDATYIPYSPTAGEMREIRSIIQKEIRGDHTRSLDTLEMEVVAPHVDHARLSEAEERVDAERELFKNMQAERALERKIISEELELLFSRDSSNLGEDGFDSPNAGA